MYFRVDFFSFLSVERPCSERGSMHGIFYDLFVFMRVKTCLNRSPLLPQYYIYLLYMYTI